MLFCTVELNLLLFLFLCPFVIFSSSVLNSLLGVGNCCPVVATSVWACIFQWNSRLSQQRVSRLTGGTCILLSLLWKAENLDNKTLAAIFFIQLTAIFFIQLQGIGYRLSMTTCSVFAPGMSMPCWPAGRVSQRASIVARGGTSACGSWASNSYDTTNNGGKRLLLETSPQFA